LPNGVPSHDTFGRVFAALVPGQFQACFAGWVQEMAGQLGLTQIAIDGKTLRGSQDRVDGNAAPYLVSAWAVENHLTLGQEAVDGKSNEITAIPKLLELLDLEGALVTIDAMGCQKEIAELAERTKWPGRQSVIVVVRDRTVGERNSCEKHYYISSRKLRAERFLEVIRGHWGIENSLHWVPDVAFDEDQSRVRKDHGPENVALVRRLALAMLKAEGSKGSIRGKRLIADWNNDFMEKLLFDFAQN
jgi:predicted transposase YbfD/YdcC